MSAASSLLNADMATLSRWARDGWRWWLDELGALVPARAGKSKGPATFLLYRGPGDQLLVRDGVEQADASAVPEAFDLALPAAAAIERTVELPALSGGDLRRYVAAEADRLLPLPPAELLTDISPVTRRDDAATVAVRIGAVRRSLVEAALAELPIAPARIGIVDGPGGTLRYDFSRQLRTEGLLPPRRNLRALWWTAVAVLALLNVAVLVWRDQQSTDALQAVVDAQAPSLTVYRAIAGRTARIDAVARATLHARATHDALADLSTVTARLPDSAWVQRYEWDGSGLKLAGYTRQPTDVAALLRPVRRFSDAHAANAEVEASTVLGQPFAVQADFGGEAHP